MNLPCQLASLVAASLRLSGSISVYGEHVGPGRFALAELTSAYGSRFRQST
jgi:hypothetical protein